MALPQIFCAKTQGPCKAGTGAGNQYDLITNLGSRFNSITIPQLIAILFVILTTADNRKIIKIM